MSTRSIAMRWPTLPALVLSLAWSAAGAQDPGAADSAAAAPVRPTIDIFADRSYYDLRSGVTRFEDNVSITRGAMAVQADQGTIRQADGQITEVELEGAPATWRDQLDDGSVVSGQATTIFYDVLANVVTLTGSAIIRHEQGEFTGDELVYDLTAESLAGRSTSGERVRVVIEPDAMSEPEARNDAGGEAGEALDEPTDASTDAPADESTEVPTEPQSDASTVDDVAEPTPANPGDGSDPNESATDETDDVASEGGAEEEDGDGETPPDPDDN